MMNFSRRAKYLHLALLSILNLIMRIPSFPHEMGNDSFGIHIMANLLSTLGYVNWWVNLGSVFGRRDLWHGL